MLRGAGSVCHKPETLFWTQEGLFPVTVKDTPCQVHPHPSAHFSFLSICVSAYTSPHFRTAISEARAFRSLQRHEAACFAISRPGIPSTQAKRHRESRRPLGSAARAVLYTCGSGDHGTPGWTLSPMDVRPSPTSHSGSKY